MERIRIAPSYDRKWLEVNRPQPLCDNFLESLFTETATGFNGVKPDHSLSIHEQFKHKATAFIFESKLNTLLGIDTFAHIDLMAGCTQFIDNVYMQGKVQVVNGDYKYHERLNYAAFVDPANLIPNIPLIIALPFPAIASTRPDMDMILQQCLDKNIPVHIDGAWITCSQGINFNFDHPAINSVGISLSKGLGLGWNRIGLRWSKTKINDSITVMNDFHMQNRMPTMVANHILDNVTPDYFWCKYKDINTAICKDFNLTPTNAIHMAYTNTGELVGLSPLLRYLMNE